MFKKIIIPLILLIANSLPVLSQSGWINQNSGITSKLNSVYFFDSNTGWACSDSGTIIKTTNGGVNWITQNSTTNLPLLTIMFGDANTGWAAGGYNDNNPLCYHDVMVVRTTNGGTTWTQQVNGIGFLFNDLFVVNNQTAYLTNSGICCPPFCIVESGGVGITNNSGQNWLNSLSKPSHSVYFLNENLGWAASRNSSDVPPVRNYISRTTDAGNLWETMFTDSMNYSPFKNIFFTDEMTGYAYRESLLKSTDAGINWLPTDIVNTSGTTNHYFVNNDTGWCTGSGGKIIRTNNGGMNWTYQSTGTNIHLNSIHFINETYGWAVGYNGTILKTITGGLTSVVQTSDIVSSFHLSQNYPNPFNPKTNINFHLPKFNFVSLKVYDALGEEIAILVNENLASGTYKTEFDGSNFASGVYFYKLTAGDFTETMRMVLLK